MRNSGNPRSRRSAFAQAILTTTTVFLFLASRTPADAGNHGYLGPVDLLATSEGTTLYVLDHDARRLDVVKGRVTDSLALPAAPYRMTWFPDRNRLAVSAGTGGGRVFLVNTDPLRIEKDFAVGHSPRGLAVSPGGERLYVADRFANVVRVLDACDGTQIAAWTAGREPLSLALTPDAKTLVVANHQPSGRANADDVAVHVTLIDTVSGRPESIPLPLRSMNVRDVALTPDGRWALVTHLLPHQDLLAFQNANGWTNSNALSIIDVENRRRLNTLVVDEFGNGAGNPWGVTCTPDGKTIVICLAGTDEVVLLDADVIRREVEEPGPESPLEYGTSNYTSNLEAYMRRIRLPIAGVRRAAATVDAVFSVGYFDDAVARIPLDQGGKSPPRIIPLGPKPVLSEVRRGEKLFHDARISRFHWQSCTSCHPDARSDGLNWDLLNDGVGNPKNTKSMLLSHVTPPAMATGVRPTAEIAVRAGLHHILFAEATERDAQCIDAYLKSLEPEPSPYLVDGRLSEAAKRGEGLFNDPAVGCATCHPSPLYTDRKAHDVGTRTVEDHRASFDTPTLVESWRTAPYLHDGRYVTIESVLRKGKHGGARRIERLSDRELDDLIEFVLSL